MPWAGPFEGVVVEGDDELGVEEVEPEEEAASVLDGDGLVVAAAMAAAPTPTPITVATPADNVHSRRARVLGTTGGDVAGG